MSLTALIDVVFLLLLFFMLTSTFSSFGEIELNRSGGTQAEADQPLQRAFVQLGANELALNGAPVDLPSIAEQIDEGLALVSLQENVTSQRLVDLLAALRGRRDLTVLVLE
ncbi:biopolymer transporter ExbD [Cribrihabitans sp. XS_ASV171]